MCLNGARRASTTLFRSSSRATSQRKILAPRRGDNLHPNWELFVRNPDGNGDDWKADEGDWLGENADIGADQHFLAVKDKGLLPDLRSAARRGGRQQDVDVAKKRQRPFAVQSSELLRLLDPDARQHRAGDQPVTHSRVEVGGPRLQTAKVKRGAFSHSDEIRGCARLVRLCKFNNALGPERSRNDIDRGEGARVRRAGEITAQPCDAQAGYPRFEAWRSGLNRSSRLRRIGWVGAQHRVVSESKIRDRACERAQMVQACDEGEGPGARQSSVRGLKAKHAAERTRHSDGSIGVRAQSDRNETARDGRRGAA